jgi:OPA family sugar phosphate sensor protein UhpC-like MFS transporter
LSCVLYPDVAIYPFIFSLLVRFLYVVALIDRLRTAPPAPEIADQGVVSKIYAKWRIRVFYSMYVGYALYYLTRQNFAFAMPSLMQDLGYDKGQLGFLTSVLALSYGASKFVSGMLGDKTNPRYLMGFGLIATGVCNILFGFSSSLYFFAIFWGLNGWFQGFGWPPCARLLTHWYSRSERGRWWSWWNTSHNIGGAVIPLVTAYCAQVYGWRMAMALPGVLVIFGGLWLINRLCDTPQSLGLPPIEKFRNDYPEATSRDVSERELSTKEILFGYVLNNPCIWILGISYFFVYLIRQGVCNWLPLYLVEAKGYTQLGAGAIVFWFEIGGILGSLLAGWSSDRLCRANRGPVNALFCLFATGVLYLFWNCTGNAPVLDSVLIFSIGVLIFGPQMLIGIAAAELSHKKAAATATGFVGWIAYLGAATAGYPLGKISQDFGWGGFFVALTACAVISTLLLFPLWNVRSAEQRALAKQGAPISR